MRRRDADAVAMLLFFGAGLVGFGFGFLVCLRFFMYIIPYSKMATLLDDFFASTGLGNYCAGAALKDLRVMGPCMKIGAEVNEFFRFRVFTSFDRYRMRLRVGQFHYNLQ